MTYGLSSKQAKVFGCTYMVRFHYHRHLFLRLSFVGRPYTPGFEREIQLAGYQPSCRQCGPTLCICPPSVDCTAVSGNAAVIVLQSRATRALRATAILRPDEGVHAGSLCLMTVSPSTLTQACSRLAQPCLEVEERQIVCGSF